MRCCTLISGFSFVFHSLHDGVSSQLFSEKKQKKTLKAVGCIEFYLGVIKCTCAAQF